MWPWAKKRAMRGKKKGRAEGYVVEMIYLAGDWQREQYMVTACQADLPHLPAIANKAKWNSASGGTLGAVVRSLFCKHLLFKALNNRKVVALCTLLRTFFSRIPARSQSGNTGTARASVWRAGPDAARETRWATVHPPPPPPSPPHSCLHWGGARFLCMILGTSAITRPHIFAPESPVLGDTIRCTQYFATNRAASARLQLERQRWPARVRVLLRGGEFVYVWTFGTAWGPLSAWWAGRVPCLAGWFWIPGLHSHN